MHDIEKLAAKALTDQLRASRGRLNPQEHEDALTYLICVVWEASRKYDPSLSPSFSQFAYRRCRLRTTDWFRQRFGNTRFGGQEKRAFLNQLSLDAPIRGADDDDSADGTLGAAHAARQDDSAGGSGTDRDFWLHGGGGGEAAWRAEVASLQVDKRVA